MKEQFVKIYGVILHYGLDILAAVIIFIVGKWLCGIISRMLEKVMIRSKIDQMLASFVKNLSYYVMLVFVLIAALSKLGIQTTSFIAVLGACGLAVGLALQGSLSNFAAGVLIIIFRPFGLNDIIEAGGAAGKVKEIQIFNTVLESSDNKIIILPNAKITGDKIVVTPCNA